jgi:glycosyltransferase involved in cell wall biosynthesis
MAGQDKGLEAPVRRLAAELGVAEAVRFPGFLDMQNKLTLGGECDVFLNTNRIDNQPVSVIEACAMGMAVVATRVGGIPDLLADGDTGLLVPDGDHQAMAAAVVRLVEEPELAGRISERGRRMAEQSAEDRVIGRWQEILSEAAATRRRVP